MATNRSTVHRSDLDTVAGNGLLHRRMFLTAGTAAAAAVASATLPNPAAADALPVEPWMKVPGSGFVGYGQPSKFESKVARTFASLPGTTGTGAARTPHHLLDGMITPNGVHFERSHSGIPDINPDTHRLLIHGLVKRPLVFTLESLGRAQQPAMPVVGFLHSQSADGFKEPLRGFRQGLKEAGYIEAENVAIEYRFAENQIDLLPVLAADLVRRPLAVIVAVGGPPAVVSAREVTSTIPIVFITGDDPVRLGFVASLARSGGNLTGISFFNAELAAKRLELLHVLVPSALRIAVLLNPAIAAISNATLRDLEPAARAMGMQIQAVNASTSGEINTAFASFARERLDALFVGPGAFFLTRRVQLAQLAARHGFPAIYAERDYVDVGGLMSYGTNLTDAYRQVGVYAGRILKGAKPADLPVLRASKFELIINAETARMLGLIVPPTLLATADEVIE